MVRTFHLSDFISLAQTRIESVIRIKFFFLFLYLSYKETLFQFCMCVCVCFSPQRRCLLLDSSLGKERFHIKVLHLRIGLLMDTTVPLGFSVMMVNKQDPWMRGGALKALGDCYCD